MKKLIIIAIIFVCLFTSCKKKIDITQEVPIPIYVPMGFFTGDLEGFQASDYMLQYNFSEEAYQLDPNVIGWNPVPIEVRCYYGTELNNMKQRTNSVAVRIPFDSTLYFIYYAKMISEDGTQTCEIIERHALSGGYIKIEQTTYEYHDL